mmetsp:Transcript_11289/g.37144  ORF Transcript_11289/g.37144 Transcript_11289/m.37144 type:complete len:217 (+) Transcript_11289:138-788(+)
MTRRRASLSPLSSFSASAANSPSRWPEPRSTNCPPCSLVRKMARRMRWIPFCGTSREMHTTSGLVGSVLRPRPFWRYRLQSALPAIVPGAKLAGRIGSIAGSHRCVSMPLRTPSYLFSTLPSVSFKKPPAPPSSVSRAYVGDTVVTHCAYTIPPLRRLMRSGLWPMVRSSIACSSVLNIDPDTPVTSNSSSRHSPVLSILWMVSTTLACWSPLGPW